MSQPILLVVTEISPGVRSSSNSSYTYTLKGSQEKHPGTTLFRPEKTQNPRSNNKETQHRVHNQSGAPRKIRGGTPRKTREQPCYPNRDRKQPCSENLPPKIGTYSPLNRLSFKVKIR